MTFRIVACLLLVASAAPVIHAADDPQARLKAVEAATSLDAPDMKPWHLKLSFQTLGPKGAVADTGTIEEWWAAGDYRISVASTGYTGTEVRNAKGVFRTSATDSIPYDLELLLRSVVHPMPPPAWVQVSKPELQPQTLGNLPLDCIVLAQPLGKGQTGGAIRLRRVPFGLFPTYCVDRGTDRLRFISDSGTQPIVLSHLGKFLDRSVAVDLWVQHENEKTATAHIEALSGRRPGEDTFASVGELTEVKAEPTKMASAVVAGTLLSKPDPIYPDAAKATHTSGSVVLSTVIGRDGSIRSIRLMQNPDPDLAIAALRAVRQWRYKPLLLNGVPAEVETTITVNFTFGPG